MLKVGVIRSLSSATPCALDQECAQRGFGVDAMRLACQTLRYNCSFSWYSGTDPGDAFDNGTGTGLMGAIQRGEFDISTPNFKPTANRVKAVSFSHLVHVDAVVLATRAPERSESDWNFFGAFPWTVWAILFGSLILAGIVLTLGDPPLNTENKIDKWASGSAILDHCFQLLKQDLNPSVLKIDFLRPSILAWLLGSIVWSSAYTGVMFSQSIITNNNAPFKDLESFASCLETGKCRFMVASKETQYMQFLLKSPNDISARIQKAVERNPILITPEMEISKRVLTTKGQYLVYVSPRYYSSMILGDLCLFHLVEIPLLTWLAFPMRKNSSHSAKFNLFAQQLFESGLQQRIRKSNEFPSSCEGKDGTDSQLVQLGKTFWYAYALGNSLAAVVALLEMFAFRLNQNGTAGMNEMHNLCTTG